MASIRERNGRWQVRWRQDGRALAETFPRLPQARRFQGVVIAAGERYPQGWVPGRGFAIEERAAGGPGARTGWGAAPGGGPTLAEWFDRAVAARTTANDRSKHDMRRDFGRRVPACGWPTSRWTGSPAKRPACGSTNCAPGPAAGAGRRSDAPRSALSCRVADVAGLPPPLSQLRSSSLAVGLSGGPSGEPVPASGSGALACGFSRAMVEARWCVC